MKEKKWKKKYNNSQRIAPKKNFVWMKRKNVYDISLIKLRKSLATVSNILIFSFSIAGRLKLRNNGRFNPSRNLNQII